MDLGLQSGVAVVTAASRGIGAATVQRLATEGMTVVAASRSAAGDAYALGAGTVVPWSHDLGDPAANATLVSAVVERFGQLDVMVLNTPGPKIAATASIDWSDWEAAHHLLLRPVVQLGTAAADAMMQVQSGAIILLSSTWVRQPASGGVLSSSYRSAASAFVKTLAAEIADRGVRVNQVMPGATGTARMQSIVEAKAQANDSSVAAETAAVVRDIPLGRWAVASEIADVVAFLASPRASFVTGASLTVDGGATRAAH